MKSLKDLSAIHNPGVRKAGTCIQSIMAIAIG
jgi:hypothetical protein